MTHAYLSVGCKAGDLCSLLPILHVECERTGQPPTLIVAKAYAPLLEGCSYVTPKIFDGHFQELALALKQAKREFDEVTVLATFGKDFPIAQRTPSFQLDQYLRAGKLDQFGTRPLVFDQRDQMREMRLLKGIKKPFILVADEAQSQPFDKINEVIAAIQAAHPEQNVVRLSTIKAVKPFDLLGLYDKSSALVTIDTLHLHLSAASKVPVLAFAADSPSPWHGSFWQPRFRFYARYSEWPTKKQEFVTALSSALRGEANPSLNGHARRETVDHWLAVKLAPPLRMQAKVVAFDTPKHAYNPSAISVGGSTILSCRHHPNRSPKTILSLYRDQWKPLVCGDEQFSYEDMRLFMFQGKLHGAYVVSTIPTPPISCLMAYGELVEEQTCWRVKSEYRPKYLGNDFSVMSKNWVFFEQGEKLYAIQNSEPQQTVLELDGDMVRQTHLSNAPRWEWGQIRGGCIIPHGGRLLRFFHSRTETPVSRYYVGAMLMEAAPPFKVLTISKRPILHGSDWETSPALHHKPRVVFPAGVVKDGEYFMLATGINDSACAMVKLSEGELNL